MSRDLPVISVIIPTHNRCSSLQRLLQSLEKQTYPLENLEVIVVADGCHDKTMKMLETYKAPYQMNIIAQPGLGAATARNKGAEYATGAILIFLDDDTEPSQGLVEAHSQAHDNTQNNVVIGYLPPKLNGKSSFFHNNLRAWWYEKFYLLSLPEHRFTYEDLLSGNFSLPRSLFNKIGGFNTRFPCREDYELGARLIKGGTDFYFVKNAMAYHRDTVTDLDRSLIRKRQEGGGDVMFGRCHPDLMHQLRLSHFDDAVPWRRKTTLNLIFRFSGFFDVIAAGLRLLLIFYEQFRMRGHWQRLYNKLLTYWYIRGIVDEFSSYPAFLNYLQGGILHTSNKRIVITVDLEQGLPEAERLLDLHRPDSVILYWGELPVGVLPYKQGVERYRSPHLRPVLKKNFALNLLQLISIDFARRDEIISENSHRGVPYPSHHGTDVHGIEDIPYY